MPPVVDHYPLGTLIVPRGQPITEQQLTLLHEEAQAYLESSGWTDHIRRGIAQFLVLSLLAMIVVLYVVRFQQGLAESLPKIIGVCTLVLLTLVLGLLFSRPPYHAVLVPLTVTALILTIAYNPAIRIADVSQLDAGHDRYGWRETR